ncbi:MAG: hypothetical protein RMJ48_14665 [Roseiflexaceae bacterium]|nr:hypothetical protein [Roseiflexaceae bacterium]
MRFLRQMSVIWTGVLLVIALVSLALPGARFFILPRLSASPTVVLASPPDGARDVSPARLDHHPVQHAYEPS